MLKNVLRIGAVGLLAAAIAGMPAQLLAQSTNQPAPAKKAADNKDVAQKKQKNLPYSGNLTAVDKKARTITVGKRKFDISSETKFFKGDKPAALEDGASGEYVTLSYKKGADGKFVAHNVYFGGKQTESASKKTKEK
jgi:hypothetical protein